MVNSTNQSVSVDCLDLSIDFYVLYRDRVITASKSVRESTALSGLCIQVFLNSKSTPCLFEKGMSGETQWLEIEISLPAGDNGTRRDGPVLTGFEVSGEAR
eukprot:gb/GEZJ01004679.1/.p2 GENE.gb/GEZJ01004679.1/~~gb/GEZJ01004679.1/.p2  ORF type:complete len:101 (-),score=7.52 gb/GEZJ01004679.1/:516-818(-)